MLTSLLLSLAPLAAPAQDGAIHTTYLWHLHQPIYWPDQRRDGVEDEYEVAWESLQQKWAGAPNPENNLGEIFGKDDRVAAYQWRVRDSIQTMLWHPEAGAQVQYSGALTENVASLGDAFQLGYSPSWSAPINEAEGWLTDGGTPRASIVNFAHHHALMPERAHPVASDSHAPGAHEAGLGPPTGPGQGLLPARDLVLRTHDPGARGARHRVDLRGQ